MHLIEYFPALHKVVVGQFAPHVSTEVDCESLFSQAGHLANPKRVNTKIRDYEHQVVAKHRLQHIYCDPNTVDKLFI